MVDPFDAEHHLLVALAWMCCQYLEDGEYLDHVCMGAGEKAIAQLYLRGLVSSTGRDAQWTAAGQAFLNANC